MNSVWSDHKKASWKFNWVLNLLMRPGHVLTVRWAGAWAPLDLAAWNSLWTPSNYMYCIPCPKNVCVYNVTCYDTCTKDINTNDQHNTQMCLYHLCVHMQKRFSDKFLKQIFFSLLSKLINTTAWCMSERRLTACWLRAWTNLSLLGLGNTGEVFAYIGLFELQVTYQLISCWLYTTMHTPRVRAAMLVPSGQVFMINAIGWASVC